jgi:phosphoglycerol transferase MdoB-like AlkP superfamily enzyme
MYLCLMLQYWRTVSGRLLLVMAILMLLRFCFWVYNYSVLPQVWTWGEIFYYATMALRFDLSSLCYINSLYIIIAALGYPFRHTRSFFIASWIAFCIPNLIWLLIEIGDIGFYRFQLRRMIFSDTSLIINTLDLFPKLIFRYWYLTLAGVVTVYAIHRGFTFFSNRPNGNDNSVSVFDFSVRNIKRSIVSLLLSAAVIIIGGRGGLQLRPINNLSAATYVKNPKWSAFLLNSGFSILSTSQRKGVEHIDFFDEDTLNAAYSLVQPVPPPDSSFHPLNVVVIALEGFSKEYSSRYNKHQGFMPFLDSLSDFSYTCEATFANAHRSTYGIAAIAAGIPCMMDDAFMFSPYQNNSVESIASLLKKKGYSTAFFHGSKPGSMGLDRFARSMSYDIFEDMSQYPNSQDFDGNWGIFDRPYLQYVCKRFKEMPKPFHGFVFTLSSHEPYTVEEDFKRQYAQLDPLDRAVLYSDDALRRFFNSVKEESWFNETLFVITADHVGTIIHPEYQTFAGRYQVPILYYLPKEKGKKSAMKKVTQQIDILPTTMDFLHYDMPYKAFGRSIFSTKKQYAFVKDLWYGYQIMDERYVLSETEGNVSVLFDYKNDPLQKSNLKEASPTLRDSMLKLLKIRIQRHHQTMLKNELR